MMKREYILIALLCKKKISQYTQNYNEGPIRLAFLWLHICPCHVASYLHETGN